MTFKREIRKVFDDFNLELSKLEKAFFEQGEELVYLISKKHRPHSYTIYEAYFHLTGRITKPFKTYKDKMRFESQVNECKYKIEQQYVLFISIYTRLKVFIDEHRLENSMQRNSIANIIKKVDKKVGNLLHIVSVDVNSEINDFLRLKEEFKSNVNFVKNKISICLHMIYTDESFIRKIDYSKLKKISEKDLQPGDVILFDEYKYYKSSYPRRRISHYIGSTILHSAIFLNKNSHNDRFLLQAGGDNRMKSYIGTFDRKSGIKYIILRRRYKLNETEKRRMETIIASSVNINFSILKLYGIALNYGFAEFYSNWFPKISQGKNILATKGIICSELITRVYNEFGVNISNYEDFSMVSPVDILNSFEFDIVGYLPDKGPKVTE